MPALAKRALSENGISPRPSANGKSSSTKKADAADAWSEGQDMALVQVILSCVWFGGACGALPSCCLHNHCTMTMGQCQEVALVLITGDSQVLVCSWYEDGPCVCRR